MWGLRGYLSCIALVALAFGCHAGARVGATTGRSSPDAPGPNALSVNDEHYDVFGEASVPGRRLALGMGVGIGLHDISARSGAMTLDGDDNFNVRIPVTARLVVVPGKTQVSAYGEYAYYMIVETEEKYRVSGILGAGVEVSARFLYGRVGVAQTSIKDPTGESYRLNGLAIGVGVRVHDIIRSLSGTKDKD